MVPIAGSSLLTVLTAATGYAYQIYFIKGLVDTALTLVSRVGDEIDSVVSSVSGEAVFCVRAGLRASAVAEACDDRHLRQRLPSGRKSSMEPG